eukprot:gene11197-23388_t
MSISVNDVYVGAGDQIGCTCTCSVNENGTTTRYFIKSHQNGPTRPTSISIYPEGSTAAPDIKEPFVYKVLELIGVGPEVHFIVPTQDTKKTLYIATKYCDLVMLKDLTPETANTRALLQLDLLGRILVLKDCTTNWANCGQVDDRPMIVDFQVVPSKWIRQRIFSFYKPDLLKEFLSGDIEYPGQMKSATWDLLTTVDKAFEEITEFVSTRGNGLHFIEEDLQFFVGEIKKTIRKLEQDVNSWDGQLT